MSQPRYQNMASDNRPPSGSSKSSTTTIVSIIAGACLLMCLGVGGLIAFILPGVQQARQAARRSVSKNSLQQIGLALHSYHDLYYAFPPGAIVDEQGVSHHSWMTQILPFTDEGYLYRRVDFNVPWDDPANADVFIEEIPIFINPAISEKTTATGNAASHYAANVHVLFENSHLRIRDLTDGISTTILGGEIHENIAAWGDPKNMRDPKLGINTSPDGFGSPFTGGANMLLGDGRVKFLSENIDPEILKALSTPAAGDDPDALGAY